MKTFRIILFLAGLIIISACSQKRGSKTTDPNSGEISANDQALLEKALAVFQTLPEIAEDEANPITSEKVALGKALYYDKRLSKDETISCNSCHNLETFGVDNLPTSPGDAGDEGDRNSPTVLNAALHFVQFWDGRAKDVEEQAGGPILEKVEMGIPSKEFLIERLSTIDEYQEMFAQAYPDQRKPLTYENIQKAIAAFERTLLTPSPFDKYLNGEVGALNDQQKNGLEAFIDKGCTTCHMGVLLGGNMYHKFGIYDDYWKHTQSEKIDEGLAGITGEESQKFMFKVPSLRNVEKTFPYYHDGSVTELNEAIEIMAVTQLNKELTDQEIADIGAFLGSLTGEVPKEALMD
ncbi:MAG: cytochrome-c peroxidase [Bacteroidales bacterium]|nr:cytochrome-c peroxidase [Bacteroidales bacterium]